MPRSIICFLVVFFRAKRWPIKRATVSHAAVNATLTSEIGFCHQAITHGAAGLHTSMRQSVSLPAEGKCNSAKTTRVKDRTFQFSPSSDLPIESESQPEAARTSEIITKFAALISTGRHLKIVTIETRALYLSLKRVSSIKKDESEFHHAMADVTLGLGIKTKPRS